MCRANLYLVDTWLELDIFPLNRLVIIGFLCADELAVEVELGIRSGGEGDDVGHAFLSVSIILRAEVDGLLLLVPVGLEEVEGVFPALAVERDKTLVVEVVGVTLAAYGRTEIEENPDE